MRTALLLFAATCLLAGCLSFGGSSPPPQTTVVVPPGSKVVCPNGSDPPC